MIQILLKPNTRRYVASISVERDNSRMIFAMIDTGAKNTVLRDIDIRVLLCDNTAKYDKILSSGSNHIITTYNGSGIYTVPVELDGCLLNGMRLSKLYGFACTDEKAVMSVIGMDFITACTASLSKGSSMNISSFDYDLYRSNFIKDCSGDQIHSINLLDNNVNEKKSLSNLFNDAVGSRRSI